MNYQKELEAIMCPENKGATLLLHSCCAPCSSAVIARLADFFRIAVFYFNPNITEQAEYMYRASEQRRLIASLPTANRVEYIGGEYEPERFFDAVSGHESDPEGGERCRICYALRLRETARLASERGFDFFTTTLSVSPLKSSAVINEIGAEAQREFGVRFLPSDFKKKDGYRQSVELSKIYSLYRQNYCGCVYSKR